MLSIACALALVSASSMTFASLRSGVALPVTLPFPAHEGLVPGETRELRVYNQDLADMIDVSDSDFGGLLAQTVCAHTCTEAEDGCGIHSVEWTGGSDRMTVAAWLPLLQIMEIRDPWQLFGWQEDDPILIWAELRCVGRVMLQGDGHVVAMSMPAPGHCAAGALPSVNVAPYVDGSLNDMESSRAERLVMDVEKLRRACAESEMLLQQRDESQPIEDRRPALGPANEGARRLRETERRARAEPPAEVGAATLAERMGALEAVLQWQSLDAAPATSLEDYYHLWNARGEREAWLQLASYAGCGWLGPAARMEALQSRSTLARLELVHRELQLQQQTWSAKLALQRLDKEQWQGE